MAAWHHRKGLAGVPLQRGMFGANKRSGWPAYRAQRYSCSLET
jgi:hypothetical protein